jgi:lipopolysaccharide/colanic/teichoic acid biosynthesis glycosyltransferase
MTITEDTLSASAAVPAPGAAAAADKPSAQALTVWGLDVVQLHARYWAAHGVQVVRQGEPSQIVRHAEMFLLVDPRSLAIFRLAPLMESLNWIQPQVLFVRLHDRRERGYRERVVTDVHDRFVCFRRLYDASDDARFMRVALTPDRDIARLWQNAPDPLAAWRRLRKYVARTDRMTVSADGAMYDRWSDREVAWYVQDLVEQWKRPVSTISRAHAGEGEVWKDPKSQIDANAKFVGPVWVGAGRHIDGGSTVIGPAVVWDEPTAKPPTEPIEWLNIEPAEPRTEASVRDATPLDRAAKRLFDLFFSAVAVLVTLPIYPLIMLAIWLEDGRPIFFAHRRETLGGAEFPCVKFRSMRKDAEKIKQDLMARNQADGPQFFIENDPRISRVGAFLRKYHLDELPQFFNVLAGHMSIVGPRPSPRKENQYCPPWREARLSVRPGITGLWQVRRTRRAGNDFQEWIKYDIEYVETRTFWLDMKIIAQTILQIVHRASK